jgi:hypothetical protein
MKQSSDLADDDLIVLKAKPLADGGAVQLVGVQQRPDIHAAIDRGELFARSDARIDQQIGHRIGDGDQMIAPPRGPAFTKAK